MTTPEKFSEQILDEATDWLVTLHSGEVTCEQKQQFEQWKNQTPEHAQAIQHVEKLLAGLVNLPENFQPDSIVNSKSKFSFLLKRNLLLSFSGFLVIALSSYLFPWAKWQSDYQSGFGKISTILLADGSKITLASDSYINVQFSDTVREIELIEGEIYIETAKDPQQRPFIVKTAFAKLEALGTQFTVRQDNKEYTKLNVYQHAVAIHPYKLTQGQVLHQGNRAVFDHTKISPPIPLKNDHPYWTEHLLVVEDWSLKKVFNELYRYQEGNFWLSEDVQNIRVSGVFSLHDIEQSLETIAFSHQLELNYYSPYFLKVTAK